MATYYWVGNTNSWSTSASSANISATSGKASFSGSRASGSFTVFFTDLIGTISSGDILYVPNAGPINDPISSGPTFTNSPTNTAGYFTTTANYPIVLKGLTTISSSATTGIQPVTGDTLIFNAYSMYTTGIMYFNSTGISLGNLNLTGFRGSLANYSSAIYGYLTVTGTITFPVARSSIAYSLPTTPIPIGLTSTTVINNNGTTAFNLLALQSIISYFAGAITLPANIIAYKLSANGSTLGSATYDVNTFIGPVANAGTSTINCVNFTGAGSTYYNVTFNGDTAAASNSYGNFYLNDSNTYNILSVKKYSNFNSIFFYVTDGVTSTANKFIFNLGTSPYDFGNIVAPGNGRITFTQSSGKFPVYIQGTSDPAVDGIGYGVYNVAFNPANTFFSDQVDYTKPSSAALDVNLRPSPSPMMMV